MNLYATGCFVGLKATYSLFLWMKMYQFNLTSLCANTDLETKKASQSGGFFLESVMKANLCCIMSIDQVLDVCDFT